ncbi:Disease resistance protein [Quillaja saponaria]|uniref:Disease resistance protein n=1 Tax=Quillaja saponaria TaxID=32244 RepID=A0AAD7PQC9_QUISA|nr:Disease resistance protein [Quillaja saponaria]KAJ7963284.1 Disease resistance protein [Quillaja saponaria]
MASNIFLAVCNVLGMLWAIYLILVIESYAFFYWLADNINWLDKESRLLDALKCDIDEAIKSGDLLESKARQFWDSDVSPAGITLQLNEEEKKWVNKLTNLVRYSKRHVATFYNLNGDVLVFNKLISLFDLVRQIRQTNDDISKHLSDSKLRDGIYQSLEKSRSKIISLQDRSIITRKNKTVSVQQSGLTTKSNNLMTKKKDLIFGMEEEMESIKLLILLQAFLKDLHGLQLESQTEKIWVEQANEIIRNAECAIDTFTRRTANQVRWISNFFMWFARHKLRKELKYIQTAFVDLLNRKKIFGCKFISRDLSESVRQPRQQQTFTFQDIDDAVISSAVRNIRNQLPQVPPTWKQVASEVNSICDQLKNIYKEFKDAAAPELLYNSRGVCLEIIRSIAQVSEKYTKAYMKDPGPKHFKEIEQIKLAINRLELIMSECLIEQKELISVVGLKEDKHTLVLQLTGTSEKSSVISIVGIKGTGKTTLAKEIFNHRNIENHFPIRAWVEVPQGNDYAILRSLATQVLTTNEGLHKRENCISKVQDHLKEKPYLLVLDNIHKKDHWDTIKAALPETMNGSRILLTTRYKTVALHAEQSTTVHQLRLRTKEESLMLFKQMVTLQPDVDKQVAKLAKKVLGRCGGLPVSIFSLGYLMSGKDVTIDELSRALERINQDQNQTLWFDTLKERYEDLDETQRNCLSYFRHFPRDFEIPKRRLVAFWVAEGLVKPIGNHSNKSEEYLAEKQLMKLIDQNMIQAVEIKPDGKVKTCRMPSTLRELMFRDNKKKTRSWSLSTSSDQRLACHFDDDDASFNPIHGFDVNSVNVPLQERNPLSILFFDTREGNKPGEDIGNFLLKGIVSGYFNALKILDLERVFRPQLQPKIIRKLVKLTYLGLRWTYLESIPSSIGNLQSLQTLDVKHTCIRTLPRSIWKLEKLRNLYLNQSFRSKFVRQPRGNSLKSLQTLWGVFIDETSPLLQGMERQDRLTNLRRLKLAFQLTQPQQKALTKWIEQLNHLQSLKLRSVDDIGDPEALRLKSLSNLQNLSTLYLLGKLVKPCILETLPQSLTDLTLSASELLHDPMPELQKLRNLKSLCFHSKSYIGNCMVCTTDGFPQLQVLKFWKLEELEEWDVKEKAMKNLIKLEIRSCKKLKVPEGLKHLSSLQKLNLTEMPDTFTTKVMNAKRKIWDDIAHSPEIIYGW